jgi:hypothetical protein
MERELDDGAGRLVRQVVNPAKPARPADEDTVGSVGVWFWGKDLQNFYTATITLDGKASIDRLNRGIWQVVVAPASPPHRSRLRQARSNEIEIVTSGNSAAFYVNGSYWSPTSPAGRRPTAARPGFTAKADQKAKGSRRRVVLAGPYEIIELK